MNKIKKLFLITAVVTLILSAGSVNSTAQGLYKKSIDSEQSGAKSDRPILRVDIDDDGEPGDDPTGPSPVGDGLYVLFALVGAYYGVKLVKNSKRSWK